MLMNFNNEKTISSIPARRKKFYADRISRLSVDEYNDAVHAIIEQIETNTKDNFFQPGWAAGSNWEGTALQPIYEKACNYNAEEAAFVYGLLVMDVFINYVEEEWILYRTEMQGRDFEQNVYLKKK